MTSVPHFVGTVLTAALLAIGTSGAQADPPPAATQPAKAVNPHWTADGCRQCHTLRDDAPAPIAPDQIDQACLACHDGKRAEREAHPIGRTFAASHITKPETWPAPGGKLGCVTCHDIRYACDRQRSRPAINPAFVRDYRPGRLLDFCSRCHADLAEHGRYNPHIMLDAEGEPIRRACQFCHRSLFDQRHRLKRQGDPALRADVINLCRNCHMEHIDFFTPGHIGATVTPDMRAYMVAHEQAGTGGRPDAAAIRRARSAGLVPTRLPLWDNRIVVCSTCHNPHQKGVFPADSTLAYGAIQTGQERKKLRLRGVSEDICIACHDK